MTLRNPNAPAAFVPYTDWIDSDPALGVKEFDATKALARAIRAGIDYQGNRVFAAADLDKQRAQLEVAVYIAANAGVPLNTAVYFWMTNGFSISDAFDYSGPKRYAGVDLAAFLADMKLVDGGKPSGA
jgi:hypothetical protein